MKMIFLHPDKHQSFLQVHFNIFGIKVSYKVILLLLMGMIKHSQSTQSNNFAISLQYFKKEVRNRIHYLHADKHQSFYKLSLKLFLIEAARHAQSTPNKMEIFLQKVSGLLLCSIMVQSIQIFYEGPVMFVVTCSVVIGCYLKLQQVLTVLKRMLFVLFLPK